MYMTESAGSRNCLLRSTCLKHKQQNKYTFSQIQTPAIISVICLSTSATCILTVAEQSELQSETRVYTRQWILVWPPLTSGTDYHPLWSACVHFNSWQLQETFKDPCLLFLPSVTFSSGLAQFNCHRVIAASLIYNNNNNNHLTAVCPVPEESFTRSHPSWSTYFLYHLSPFATVHGILFIQLKQSVSFSHRFQDISNTSSRAICLVTKKVIQFVLKLFIDKHFNTLTGIDIKVTQGNILDRL